MDEIDKLFPVDLYNNDETFDIPELPPDIRDPDTLLQEKLMTELVAKISEGHVLFMIDEDFNTEQEAHKAMGYISKYTESLNGRYKIINWLSVRIQDLARLCSYFTLTVIIADTDYVTQVAGPLYSSIKNANVT